jgi:6-phosphogluconolactonase
MDFNRRTFSAMLAGTVVAPRLSLAQAGAQSGAPSVARAGNLKSALYSGVGTELTHYEVDTDAATLARRGSVRIPAGIQYAWPHPSRNYLYVSSSSGGPGLTGDNHHLAAFRVGPSGELSPHGEMVRLRYRPIHTSVDIAGEYVLVAYNFPPGVTVHRIKGDGRLGDEVSQPDNLEKGIYFHQIRATPGNKTLLVVARGNNAAGGKPEDPGSLHVYGIKNGVLSNLRKIAPNGGYGFGPRHLDIHPAQPLVYVSIERQNQLIVFRMTADGDLVPEPLFIKSSLGDPAHLFFPVQAAGPIHIHPNGRLVYQGNRSGVGGAVVPGIEEVGGKLVYSGGESNIAVYAINQQTGEPNAVQHADIHAAHPRTFSLDAAAKLLVAGSLAPTAVREAGKVVDIPAGLSVFRVGADGKLDYVRKYDIDVGKFTQWWSGMIPLA